MNRVVLVLLLAFLVTMTAGCQIASRLTGVRSEDISDIEMKMQTGLPGASADFVVRRDGSAELTCNFYRTGEQDLKEDSFQVNAITVCGKRYKNARNSFAKVLKNGGGDYMRGISNATASPDQFSKLADLIVRNGYFSMADLYEVPGLMDAPPDITRVVYLGGEKKISNQGGKGGPKLGEIQKAIYAMVNELEWH